MSQNYTARFINDLVELVEKTVRAVECDPFLPGDTPLSRQLTSTSSSIKNQLTVESIPAE